MRYCVVMGLTPYHTIMSFKSIRNDNVLDCSKWKTFADDKINAAQELKIVLGSIYKILREKEKMLVGSIFSFSCNVFKQTSFQGSFIKPVIVWLRVNDLEEKTTTFSSIPTIIS